MGSSRIFCAFVLFALLFGVVDGAGRKYNTKAGPVKGKLNVHLVPHTHNDVGWLKTVDQYFYGANNTIQNAGVQYIIDSVVAGLLQNPDRKFIYVETGFFARWWREQTPAMKASAQTLVDNGQLTFINGGWAMHDEANPHYHSMVDQTTFGHQFLLNNLGAVPKVGWQIDPFGHSGTQAALLTAEVGFDSLYFARNDYQDYIERELRRDLEMVWQGSPSLGSSARVFTGVLFRNSYCAPSEFNWNVFSNAKPIMDDPALENYNVQGRVDAFVDYVTIQSLSFKTDNIIIPMGCDFEYQGGLHWYKNIDKLIHWVNLDGRVNAFYSTPEIYTQAKHAANATWTLKTDDFMPISSAPNAYWTGFFTSRPTLKRWSRDNVMYYPLARQIAAAAGLTNSSVWDSLLDAIGLSSHHDAITGTEKQHVAFDYAKHLSVGRTSVRPVVSAAVDAVIGSSVGGDWQECVLANVSVCPITQYLGAANNSNTVKVMLWNPSSQVRVHTVRIPVGGSLLTVTDNNGVPVVAEVVAASNSVTNYGPASGSNWTLVFQVTLPQMGWSVYTLTEGSTAFTQQGEVETRTRELTPLPKSKFSATNLVLENGVYKLTFSNVTGAIESITNLVDGSSTTLTQEWLYYKSAQKPYEQRSGAYIFRPIGLDSYPVGTTITNDQIVQGQYVSSVHQTFGPYVEQTIRLYRNSSLIEIEYTVGAIDVNDGQGKEIISRFTTGLKSGDQWWVDSNGRDMQYRRRNWRESWKYIPIELIAGNFFPTTTHLFINDTNATFTVYTETSQSTSSILNGSVELMAHRRILHDDGFGVGEVLNETEFITPYTDNCAQVACGQHYGPGLIHRSRYWISLTASSVAARTYRPALDKIFYDVHQMYSNNTQLKVTQTQGSLMTQALPENVQVMTLERVNGSTILLRLSHQFGSGEDAEMSSPVGVDLSKLFGFSGLSYVGFVEMSLTANQLKASMRPLVWNIEGEANPPPPPYRPADSGSVVYLAAMQIRTFYVTVK